MSNWGSGKQLVDGGSEIVEGKTKEENNKEVRGEMGMFGKESEWKKGCVIEGFLSFIMNGKCSDCLQVCRDFFIEQN